LFWYRSTPSGAYALTIALVRRFAAAITAASSRSVRSRSVGACRIGTIMHCPISNCRPFRMVMVDSSRLMMFQLGRSPSTIVHK
jgi:hypothetical protein